MGFEDSEAVLERCPPGMSVPTKFIKVSPTSDYMHDLILLLPTTLMSLGGNSNVARLFTIHPFGSKPAETHPFAPS